MKNNCLKEKNIIPSYALLKSLIGECEFYKRPDYQSIDIRTWPVINKLDIIQNYDQFTYKLSKSECIKCSTTGSSGLILDTFWSPKDYYQSLLHMWRIRKDFGIYPYSTYCTCHSNAYFYETLLKHKIIIDKNQISLSKLVTDGKILSNYIKTLFEYNVKWLLLQPSLLLKIILYAESNGIQLPQFSYIECTGETLSKEVKDYIYTKFPGATVIDSYGMQEFNTIGYSTGNGFNILSNNVYVEVLNDGVICEEGEIGDIIISGLCNTLMPYIRYKTGDKGTLIGGKLFLKNTSNNDSITRDGKTYDASIFWEMIEHFRIIGYSIIQFQFISKKNDLYCDIFSIHNTLNSYDIGEKIKKYLYERYKLEFDRVYVNIRDLQEYISSNNTKHFYFKEE